MVNIPDIPTEVMHESIRRMMNECLACEKFPEEISHNVMQAFSSHAEMRRFAALNNVMKRIILSTGLN